MSKKVVVVGTGMVGASYAFAMVNQNVADEVVLIDLNQDLANAHAQDMTDGNIFLETEIKIKAGTYADCHDADLVCITAGAPQKEGQTRLDLATINAKITKSIVTSVMDSGFDGILLMAINPVDVMTYVAQKVSKLPEHRVIGSGTSLDSARFRKNLSNYFGVSGKSINAKIIGEHGDSSLPLWTSAFIGPKNILDYVNESNGKYTFEDIEKCFDDARLAAYEIIQHKGSTYYGIGLSLTNMTKDILTDQNSVLSLSAKLDGQFGIEDVYISVPVIVGRDGVREVLNLNMSYNEKVRLQASADEIKKAIKLIKSEGIID